MLEIGTGTGYNAALLCHRLGSANVYSVNVEPDLIDIARERLRRLGFTPTLVAGDGAAGLPVLAPFDRIIATCAVAAIPWAWVEQVPVGGAVSMIVWFLAAFDLGPDISIGFIGSVDTGTGRPPRRFSRHPRWLLGAHRHGHHRRRRP